MLRKFTAPILILLMIAQIGAAWTVFSTALWVHRQNKQARLADKEKWVEFALSSSEFEANLLDGSEIKVNGTIYDIVFAEQIDNLVHITAVADHAENKLMRTLNGIQEEQTGWSDLAKKARDFNLSFFFPELSLQTTSPAFIVCSTYFNYPPENCRKGLSWTLEQPPAA